MNDVDNPVFLILGYGLTWAVLGWYALRLARRLRGTPESSPLAESGAGPAATAGTPAQPTGGAEGRRSEDAG